MNIAWFLIPFFTPLQRTDNRNHRLHLRRKGFVLYVLPLLVLQLFPIPPHSYFCPNTICVCICTSATGTSPPPRLGRSGPTAQQQHPAANMPGTSMGGRNAGPGSVESHTHTLTHTQYIYIFMCVMYMCVYICTYTTFFTVIFSISDHFSIFHVCLKSQKHSKYKLFCFCFCFHFREVLSTFISSINNRLQGVS